ncbi:MAG: hypothetical protein HC902_05145 [Calothrix sp. SM1_5_4]|nr:hypothetical protein [Calothrix sp. SM1_5_4]
MRASEFGLKQDGHSVYRKPALTAKPRHAEDTGPGRKSRPQRQARPQLLCVTASKSVTALLDQSFRDSGCDYTIVGTTTEATGFINFHDVSLVVLDLDLPGGGPKWLLGERTEGLQAPVLLLGDGSAEQTESVTHLLSQGPAYHLLKSRIEIDPSQLKELVRDLIQSQADQIAKSSPRKNLAPTARPELVMIGASTGGPQALLKLLEGLPPTHHLSWSPNISRWTSPAPWPNVWPATRALPLDAARTWNG